MSTPSSVFTSDTLTDLPDINEILINLNSVGLNLDLALSIVFKSF